LGCPHFERRVVAVPCVVVVAAADLDLVSVFVEPRDGEEMPVVVASRRVSSALSCLVLVEAVVWHVGDGFFDSDLPHLW